MLLLSGRANQKQFGENCALGAGDTVICDSAYAGEYNLVTASKVMGLKIPRIRLGALLPHMTRFAGAKLDKDPLALRLLSGYLTGTLDVDLGGGGDQTARLHQDHIIDLVALALGAKGESRVFAEQGGAQSLRRAAIIQAIETSMADPAFDTATVAARLGITVRYVHYLLEATGRTFSEHLLGKRLAKAVELLCDPQQSQRRIADIAFEVGFRDLSYFNRMFRRTYGGTPTDLRQAARDSRPSS